MIWKSISCCAALHRARMISIKALIMIVRIHVIYSRSVLWFAPRMNSRQSITKVIPNIVSKSSVSLFSLGYRNKESTNRVLTLPLDIYGMLARFMLGSIMMLTSELELYCTGYGYACCTYNYNSSLCILSFNSSFSIYKFSTSSCSFLY